MPEEVMAIALMGIACATGVLCYLIHTISSGISRRAASGSLATEIRELKEEIAGLRQRNNDVILALETLQQQQDSLLRSRREGEPRVESRIR